MPPKKRKTNNNGSTLLVVVVFIALLTMMGAALLVSTAAHLKAQKVQEDRKFAFYSAEAGIDEVIARLSEQVQKIHGEATEAVNEPGDPDNPYPEWRVITDTFAEHTLIYEEWLANKRIKEGEMPPFTTGTVPPLYSPDAPLKLYNEDGTINQIEARKLAEGEYKNAFKRIFLEYIRGDGTATKKANFICIPTPKINPSDSEPTAVSVSELEAAWNTKSASALLDATTWGNKLDLSKDKLYNPTDAVVKVGIYKENNAEKYIEFNDNDELKLPIFSIYNPTDSARKLITVNVTVRVPQYDLPIIVDQNVMKFEPNILWTKALTADGDIIVNNGDNTSTVYGNIYAGGNIIVGNTASAELTLNGEAVAGSDITFGASNSTFTINGNAYANNVVVGAHDLDDSNIAPINGCTLSVNSNSKKAYTSYSLSEMGGIGSTKDMGDVVTKNRLELRGINSHINIKKNYIGFTGPRTMDSDEDDSSFILVDLEPGSDSTIDIEGEAVIGGSAFLEFEDGFFSTGESVAFRNNFMGYSNWLVGSYLSDFIGDLRGRYGNIDGGVELDLTYKNYYGMFAPTSYGGYPLYVPDRADYFYRIFQMEKDPILEDNNMIPYITNYGAVSLGSYIGYGVAFNGNDVEKSNEIRLSDKEWAAETMFYRQVNAFGDLAVSFTEDNLLEDATFAPKQTINNLFTFTSSFNSTSTEANDYTERVDISNGNVTLSEEKIKGVIVAQGDVYITEDVTEFRGTIIAGGDIIIQGNTTIINDRDFIAKALACYNDGGVLRGSGTGFTSADAILPTYSLFTPKSGVAGDYITKEDYTYVHDKDVDISDKYNSINGLVVSSNWKVIEY